ncbi:MAG: type II toxin-antitoxin system VapC family toxin, partial [Candidatus Omnitrophica bacterium]|nr:type II toxin-antitoxin system VapC family toxin [Candidatus Omnitrophota bacterium]
MVFVDTSAFFAIENERDRHHVEALDTRHDLMARGERLITSDYILDEVYTLLRMRVGHRAAVDFGESIRTSRFFRIEPVTTADFEAAWRIFRRYDDKPFSFTDCTTVALMRKESIENIATFDEDFQELKEMNV